MIKLLNISLTDETGEFFQLHLLIVLLVFTMTIPIETGVLLPYLGIGAAAGRDSAEELLQLDSVIGRLVATVIRKVVDHTPDKNLQNL